MVHKWVKAGMPLESMVDAEAWRSKRLAEQGTGKQAPRSLNDTRERKIGLECELLELRLAVERADYLPAAEVEEAMMAAGALFSGGLASMVNDLPGMLAGLAETEIKAVLISQADRLVEDFKKKLNDDIDKTKRKARAAKVAASAGKGAEKPAARASTGVGRGKRKASSQRTVKKV